MEIKKCSRRDLLKTSAKAGLLAPLAVGLLNSQISFGEDLSLVDAATDPVAKALKYSPEKSAVAKDLQKEKMGVPFAGQNCANCQLYKKVGTVGKDEVGKCTMIMKGHVKAHGWCTSWTKKA